MGHNGSGSQYIGPGDLRIDLLPPQLGLPQGSHYVSGQGCRNLHEGGAIKNVNGADVTPHQASFVSDGSYQVTRAQAILTAQPHEEPCHARFGLLAISRHFVRDFSGGAVLVLP